MNSYIVTIICKNGNGGISYQTKLFSAHSLSEAKGFAIEEYPHPNYGMIVCEGFLITKKDVL